MHIILNLTGRFKMRCVPQNFFCLDITPGAGFMIKVSEAEGKERDLTMAQTYTIGELAELAGISVKTLRVYERKGLLLPQRNAQNGYRIYTEDAVRELEKIQLMKYLGFSLEQIEEFLRCYETVGREEMLLTQKHLLERKREQLDSVISCVEGAVQACRENEMDGSTFLRLLSSIVKNRRADDLVWSLGKYSDEPRGWSRFIFEQAHLASGMHILDAGAGYGNLWRYNRERIPETVRITCVDRHNTHADSFFEYVKEKEEAGEVPQGQFSFLWDDLELMKIKEKYHCIFFNHVASFIQEKERLYEVLRFRLLEGGVFICTWGGCLLLENVKTLLGGFLENLQPVLRRYNKVKAGLQKSERELRRVFPEAERHEYITTLRFDTAEEYMDYLLQLGVCKPVEALLEQRRNEFLRFLREEKRAHGKYEITRDTYLFRCQKGGIKCLPE